MDAAAAVDAVGALVVPCAMLEAAIETTMVAIAAKIAEKFILISSLVLRFELNTFKF